MSKSSMAVCSSSPKKSTATGFAVLPKKVSNTQISASGLSAGLTKIWLATASSRQQFGRNYRANYGRSESTPGSMISDGCYSESRLRRYPPSKVDGCEGYRNKSAKARGNIAVHWNRDTGYKCQSEWCPKYDSIKTSPRNDRQRITRMRTLPALDESSRVLGEHSDDVRGGIRLGFVVPGSMRECNSPEEHSFEEKGLWGCRRVIWGVQRYMNVRLGRAHASWRLGLPCVPEIPQHCLLLPAISGPY